MLALGRRCGSSSCPPGPHASLRLHWLPACLQDVHGAVALPAQRQADAAVAEAQEERRRPGAPRQPLDEKGGAPGPARQQPGLAPLDKRKRLQIDSTVSGGVATAGCAGAHKSPGFTG